MFRLEKKKLIALLIVIMIMVNNFFPIMVFADGNTAGDSTTELSEEVTTNYEIKEEEEWDISKNGDGSVKAKWKLEDRSLTITGSGEMKVWDSISSEDWHSTQYTKIIEKVIINNGITRIGERAFEECKKLESVEIPNSVTSIGTYAFYKCSSLNSIKIPNSVTIIGDYAFTSSSLTSITISNNIKRIGNGAFSRSVNLISINVEENNSNYASIDGVLYNKEKTELICCPAGKNEKNYSIPNNVTTIGDFSFEKSSLTNIIIPNSIKIIEQYAFKESSLISIKIPDGVTEIKDSTFYGCNNLIYVELPNSVTSINHFAFAYCNCLKSIVIPNGVTEIKYSTFNECSSLESIEIPNSVTSIEKSAFSGCSSLESIEIPNSVTSIGNTAFTRCSSLESIKIPNSVTSIGDNAFESCYSLKSIEIPNSVTSIGKKVFEKCGGIKICNTNSEAHRYLENAKIGYVLKDNIESEYTKEYEIKNEEEWDISENGKGSIKAKWNLEEKSLIITGIGKMKNWDFRSEEDWHYKYSCVIEKVYVGNGITNIGNYAFYKCTNLTSINISNDVIIIGDCAFENCENLENIELPNSVTTIGDYAFLGCSSLVSIKIPDGVKEIKSVTFYGCSSLTNIELPNSVTRILTDAFRKCSSLSNIRLPCNLIDLTSGALELCSNLENINIENNSKFFSIDGVLYNIDKTCIIKYPEGKKEKTYAIPNSVTSIKSYAFYECENLECIEIPNSVTSIGIDAFSKCENLKNITIPDSITSIKDSAFWGCNSLESITIPNSVVSIEEDAFRSCKGPIICKTNSEAHRYAESEKIGYILDKVSPRLNVIYSTANLTNKDITVTITANEEIQAVTGWTLLADKKTLTKTYSQNTTEEVTVKDLVGNETKHTIQIDNIVQANADLDGNNKIEPIDLLYLLRHNAQESSSKIYAKHPTWKLDTRKFLIADINKNGKIDNEDILKINRYIAASSSQKIANKHSDWLNFKN